MRIGRRENIDLEIVHQQPYLTSCGNITGLLRWTATLCPEVSCGILHIEVAVKVCVEVSLTMCEGSLGNREDDNGKIFSITSKQYSFRCRKVILLGNTTMPYMSQSKLSPNSYNSWMIPLAVPSRANLPSVYACCAFPLALQLTSPTSRQHQTPNTESLINYK